MFVGQVVDLDLNSFPSFFSREECGHAVRLSSGDSSVCRISFAWQHRSPSGREVLHLELELKEP